MIGWYHRVPVLLSFLAGFFVVCPAAAALFFVVFPGFFDFLPQ